MNREIEERIVAMYFDNKDFEKNAQQTIETLGQLQNSMNLEQASKGFDVFDRIGQKLNTSKLSQSIGKMKNTIGGMKGSMEKVFKIGSGPVQEMESIFSSFRGYLNKFIGFDIAGKIVNSVESTLRGLTIAPISAGWNQYESKMDSVKTIMSGTGESIDFVNQKLDDLTEYANKTIYSLTDMTSNLGKFTNNGMKLEDATAVMKGLANATADAGQGAQQASMAMYNVSQAFGTGKMLAIDWKSLENANIATTRLKQTFLDMAAAGGNIKKVTKEVNGEMKDFYYYTKNSKDQELKNEKEWTELTTANFREYLSKGWLDAETMKRTFMVFGGELDRDTLESWGILDKEEQDRLIKIGQDATEAATQVRTFTKMMDALKESVQSGWSDTFEQIFGDMESGTNLWTRLNEEIDGILSKSTETRNKILKDWNETREELGTENVEHKVDTSVYDKELEEKRAEIERLQKMLSDDQNRMSEEEKRAANKEININNKDIAQYERRVAQLKKSLNGKNSKMTAEERQEAGKELDQLQSEITKKKKLVEELKGKLAYDKNSALTKKEREQAEKDLEAAERDAGLLERRIERLHEHDYYKEETIYGRSGREIMIDSLFELIDVFKELGEAISESFTNVFGSLDGSKLFEMTKGFEDFVHRVKDWLGGRDDPNSRISKIQKALEGVFNVIKVGVRVIRSALNLIKRLAKPVVDLVINAFGGLGEFLSGFGDLTLPEMMERLGKGLQESWEKIKKFFTPQDVYDDKGFKMNYQEIPAVRWIKNLWEGLKKTVREWADENGLTGVLYSLNSFADSITSWEGWTEIGKFFDDGKKAIEDAWNSVTEWIDNAFKPKRRHDENGHELKDTRSDVSIFLDNIWQGVKDTWDQIVKWEGWTSISTFLNNTWSWITGLFRPARRHDENGHELSDNRAPIVKFLGDIWDGIKKTWETITTWSGWTSVSTFLNNTWSWVTNLFKPARRHDENGHELKDNRAPIVKFLGDVWEGVKETWNAIVAWPVWTSISTFLNNTWSWVTGLFKPKRRHDENGHELSDNRAPIVKFLGDIWDGVKSAWDTIVGWEGWQAIGNFLSDTWGWIVGLFKGNDTSTAGASQDTIDTLTDLSELGKAMDEAGDSAPNDQKVSLLTTIIEAIGGFFETVKEFVKDTIITPEMQKFLDNTYDFFSGIVTFVGNIAGTIGRVLKGEATAGDWTGTAIVGILAAVGYVLNFIKTKNMANIGETESFAKKFMELGAGLLMLSAAVSLLTTIDQAKMWPAAGVIAGLGIVLAIVVGVLTKLNQSKAELAAPTTVGERIVNNLVNTLGRVGTLFIAMKLLPEIIKTIGDVKKELGGDVNIGEDVFKSLLGVITTIAGVGITLALVQKMVPTGLNPAATFMTIVSVLEAIGMAVLAFGATGGLMEAIDGLFGNGSTEAIGDAIAKVGILFNGIGKAIGDLFRGLFGQDSVSDHRKEMELEEFMGSMSEMAEVLDSEKISGMTRLMTLITTLSGDANAINTGKLENFASAMEQLGTGILMLNRVINGVDDLEGIGTVGSEAYQKFDGAIELIRHLMEALSPAGGLEYSNLSAVRNFVVNLGSDEELLGRFVDGLKNIISKLGEIGGTDGIQFDGMAIATKLFSAIDTGLKDPNLPAFDATSVVDAILKAINLGDTAIALAVHNMVQRGLELKNRQNPTDASSVTEGMEAKLLEMLSNPTEGVEGLFDQTQINNMLYGEDGKGGLMGTLTGAMGELKGMDNFGDILSEKFSMPTIIDPETQQESDILSMLSGQLTDLQTQVSEMPAFEIKITPVFDMSNLTDKSIQEMLAERNIPMRFGQYFSMPDNGVDYTAMRAGLGIDSILEKLESIDGRLLSADQNNTSSLDLVRTSVGNVATSFRGMKVILNGSAIAVGIVDDIDRLLYRKSILAGMTE